MQVVECPEMLGLNHLPTSKSTKTIAPALKRPLIIALITVVASLVAVALYKNDESDPPAKNKAKTTASAKELAEKIVKSRELINDEPITIGKYTLRIVRPKNTRNLYIVVDGEDAMEFTETITILNEKNEPEERRASEFINSMLVHYSKDGTPMYIDASGKVDVPVLQYGFISMTPGEVRAHATEQQVEDAIDEALQLGNNHPTEITLYGEILKPDYARTATKFTQDLLARMNPGEESTNSSATFSMRRVPKDELERILEQTESLVRK